MLSEYKIYIKGMVCDRCILSIREVMKELNLPITHVSLGEVTTVSALTMPDMEALKKKLEPLGFALLEDRKTTLVRELKGLVEAIYSGDYDFPADFRFSDLVVNRFNKDYKVVSNVFSSIEGMTLEKYIIEYRIEKIKELLVYSDDTLSDIAFRLGFSSVAHLSRQFKARTGLNTSHFKEIRQSRQSLSGHQPS
jgi:AraC-like DNA-binding protein